MPDEDFRQAAVSPEGKRLACADIERLYVVDPTNRKEIVNLPGNSGGIRMMALSPSGRTLASIGFDRGVLLWDVISGRIVKRFQEKIGQLEAIAWSPNGKYLAGSSSDTCVIWDVKTGRQIARIGELERETIQIQFLDDNERLAIAGDSHFEKSGVSLYHFRSGTKVHEFAMPESARHPGIFHGADGRLVEIHAAYRIRNRMSENVMTGFDVCDVFAARVLRHLDICEDTWVQFAISSDCRTLAARDHGAIRLWELASGKLRSTIQEPVKLDKEEPQARPFAFSPDGLTLATASNNKSAADLWDVPTGKRFGSLPGHEQPITTLEFTPDGRRLLTGSDDSTILGWDLTRPEWRSRPLSSNLSDKDLAFHWERLRSATAEDAYRSKWALAGDPTKTIDLFRSRLPSAPSIPAERIKSWIADLDASQYSVRERAQSELQHHFFEAEGPLRKSLTGSVTAEARIRISRIIDASFAAIPQPDHLRDLRAIEVLEQIGTPEARDLLRRLAASEVPTSISRDAAQSLKRLEARPR
jgi:WD40 repeat protein